MDTKKLRKGFGLAAGRNAQLDAYFKACNEAADEIDRLRALVDIGYDHLLSCGYREEDPTLTQLRAGLTPNALAQASGAGRAEETTGGCTASPGALG